MAYKRYVKRGNKLCGPYYYESYRDKYGKVQKRYVGTRNPAEKKPGLIKAVGDVVPTFNRGKKPLMTLSFFFFLFVLIVIVLGGVFFIGPHVKLTGFVVYDGSDSGVSNESIVQTFDTPKVDLEIKEPAKLNGEAVTENKNKRMDFETSKGPIRLYFDLLNYSEFVENTVQEVNVSVVPTNITVEENITETNLTENNITEETNITSNVTIPETNLTNETSINQTTENETNPIINNTTPINETNNETNPINETNETGNETINQESNETGNTITSSVIGVFRYPFRFIESIFKVTGKAVDDLSNSNSSENNLTEAQAPQTQTQEINILDIKDKINELNEMQVDKIADNSIIPAENFDINVSQTPKTKTEDKYKWGYKVKLKDLKFMAKIDVTSNISISQYDSYTLRIGDNLLSFKDLVDRGYNVTIELPALNIPVNVTVAVINETNLTEINNANESEMINNTNSSEVGNESSVSEINNSNESSLNNPEVPAVGDNNSNSSENNSVDITGNIIRGLAGLVVGDMANSSSNDNENSTFAVPDIEYNHTVSVYIERDFTDNPEGIKVGDIINLDPTLILVTKAEHLDSNRSFISDIYDYVKTLDNNWSEIINENEYVRVTFEQNLSKDNDMTIYAKSSNWDNETNSSISSEIGVYRQDSDEEIARFSNITNEGYYKIYLTGLDNNESLDVFDLKILNNPVKFDYIVDPSSSLWINMASPLKNTYYNIPNPLFNVSSSEEGYNGSIIPNLDGSLVLWWKMGDDDVNLGHDSSGYGNDGVNNGSVLNSSGRFGYSGDFNGSNNIHIEGFKAITNKSFTICLWAKSYSLPNGNYLFGQDGTQTWYTDLRLGDSSIEFDLANSSDGTLGQGCGKSYDGLSSGYWSNWSQYCLSVNDSNYSLFYFNGVYKDSKQCFHGNGNSDFTIGQLATYISDYPFNGSIDDVIIFNRSLTKEEIKGLYNATRVQHSGINLINGSHTFIAYTENSSGNITQTPLTNFYIDTVFPFVNISYPGYPADIVFGASPIVNVSFYSNDSMNNISTVVDWDNSLVSWWRMDDLNGNTVVDVMERNNGTYMTNGVASSPQQVDNGKFGKAMHFDGDYSKSYIDAGNDNSLNMYANDFTLSLWVKSDSYTPQAQMASKGLYYNNIAGYSITYTGSDITPWVCFIASNGTSDSNQDPCYILTQPSNWTNFIGVRRGNYVEFWVNGTLDPARNKSAISGYLNNTKPFTIGWSTGSSGQFFNGSIDDVMLFNRSLSRAEILALYGNTSQKYLNYSLQDLGFFNHDAKAFAQDSAGNVNQTGIYHFNFGPLLKVVSPLNKTYEGYYQSGIPILFNISMTDVTPQHILSYCSLSIYDINGNLINDGSYNPDMTIYSDGPTYSYSYAIANFNDGSGYLDGVYSFNATCNDTGNNINTVPKTNFTIETGNNVSGCRTLSLSQQYNLTGDIVDNFNMDCITINAPSVTLDCNGHSIYTTAGINHSGIFSNQPDGSIIKNCNITMGNGPGGIGINASSAATGLQILNNSFGDNNISIYLNSVTSAVVANNSVKANSGTGIYLASSTNNNLTSNNFSTISGNGIYIDSSTGSTGNRIFNNNVSASSNNAIYLAGNLNNIISNTITSSSGNSILVLGNSNNLTSNTASTGSGNGFKINGNYNIISYNNITSSSGNGTLLYSAYSTNLTGNNFSSSSGNGISVDGNSNITNLINNFASSGASGANFGNGIYLGNSSLNNLTSNTGVGTGSSSSSSDGIYISSSCGPSNFAFNNGLSTSENGIFVNSPYNNFTLDNASSGGSSGLYVSSNFNNFNYITAISNSPSYIYGGVYLSSVHGNNFYNTNAIGPNGFLVGSSYSNNFYNINSSGSTYGFYIKASNNSNVIDCINISGNTKDVYVDSISGTNNFTFLNCSYSITKEFVNNPNNITRAWWYSAYANDSYGALINASLSVYDTNNIYISGYLTSSSGYVNKFPIIDYVDNGAKTYYSNYTINVTKAGHAPANHSYNITVLQNIINDSFTLSLSSAGVNGYSLGAIYNKTGVNYNENVNLSVVIPQSFYAGSAISRVWAEITNSSGGKVNVTLTNSTPTFWNATYNPSGNLGDYNVLFKANLTDGNWLFNDVTSNFSVQNMSISINSPVSGNTSEKININGLIQRTNGTSSWNLTNTPFVVKINNVLVSTDSSHGNETFSQGNFTNMTQNGNNLTLNLSGIGGVNTFLRDYTSAEGNPTSDSHVIDSSNVGWDESSVIFQDLYMMSGIGNITYRFTTPTEFYGNATTFVHTIDNPYGSGGGNTSIWYSYDNSAWYLASWTTINGNNLINNISVNGNSSFYIKLMSDTSGDKYTPIDKFNVSYREYQYPTIGNFSSNSSYFSNVSYTNLKWIGSLNSGSVKIQLRESDDNSNWSSWSQNYTGSTNEITNFSKAYLQYMVWLNTTNLSTSPVVKDIIIEYSNTTTNSTGGYDYNVTVPATEPGVRNLTVLVTHSDSGIVGTNQAQIELWTKTAVVYYNSTNYTAGTNYSIFANLTRQDNGNLVNGSLSISIFPLASIDNPSLQNRLVSYWKFNENYWLNSASGLVKDSMGLNNGTAIGGANTTADAMYGRAGYFNGNSYVNFTVAQDKNSTALWIKNSTANSWTFVAYNGTNYFVNGVVGTPNEYPLNISGNNVKVGVNGSVYFNGSIDEVMIFNRSLTKNEIQSLYNLSLVNRMNTSCLGSQCFLSALVPQNLSWGNYSVYMTGSNQSGYYYDSSSGYYTYLEESSTNGGVFVDNKTINDYVSNEYSFPWNFTVNNTGNASMNNPVVYATTFKSQIKNITQITNCSGRIYPGQVCNISLIITLNGGIIPESYNFIQPLKFKWTDNNGSDSSPYTGNMGINIIANVNIVTYINETNLSLLHNSNSSFNFLINYSGTGETINNIRLNFSSYNITTPYAIPSSWIIINPSLTSLTYGNSQNITVNISVPQYTPPRNYSGVINITSDTAPQVNVNLKITVNATGTWYFVPNTNFSYNHSFSFNTLGEIANYTIFNTGNINLTFKIDYSPSGTNDYTYYYPNQKLDPTNPASLFVQIGGNATIRINQTGYTNNLLDVGVITTFTNQSASPASASVKDAFNIEGQPPQINDILMSYDNFATNQSFAEVNKNITIKIIASDDEGLNLTATQVNVSYLSTTNSFNAGVYPGEEQYGDKNVNFSIGFKPTNPSYTYAIKAVVYDKYSKVSQTFNKSFKAYGTTNVLLSQNYSSINVSNVDLNNKGIIYINYTINNTGNTTAYSPNLSFSGDNKITRQSYLFNDLAIGTSNSTIVQLNVSEATPPGLYNMSAVLSWINPYPSGNVLYSTPALFNITVLTNKSLVYNPVSLDYSVNSGGSNSSIFEINNTGNVQLTGVRLNCSIGNLCQNFSFSFNATNFNISVNKSRKINITINAPAGLASNPSYSGYINLSEQNISYLIIVSANVPPSYTWLVSNVSINTSRGSGQSGNLQEITINNTGNNNLNFTITSSNSSIVYANVSSIAVPIATSRKFMLNYTAPNVDGSYSVIINVTGTTNEEPNQRNITVNLTSTNMAVIIKSPKNDNPTTNISPGNLIEVHANAFYSGNPIINSSNWSVNIGGANCYNLSSYYDTLGSYWKIFCYVPNLPDGKAYDLTATIINSQHGEVSSKETGAVIYRDITPPNISPVRNNINKGENISLMATVNDNVGVGSVWAYVTYPNLTVVNLSLSNSSGYYSNNTFGPMDLAGEYLVNYSANDTTGNLNSVLDWFEVYDYYPWNINLTDYQSNPVKTPVNITLYRPNSTTLLMNGITDNGYLLLNVNRRFYDLSGSINDKSFLIKNINFTNISSSNISLNFHEINGEDLSDKIVFYYPFKGLASGSTGFRNNYVSITFNYSGLAGLYDNPLKLSIIKCDVWNYTQRKCDGTWSLVPSTRDINARTLTGNSTDLATYFISENKCGNGLCEALYGEDSSNCESDCKTSTPTTINNGGGGGGGGGTSGLSTIDLAKIEDIVKSFLDIGGIKLETTLIYKEMFAGETTTVRITLKNTLNEKKVISLEGSGDVKQFLFFESNSITLAPKESRDVLIKIVAPKTIQPANYDGNLVLRSGNDTGSIPVTVRILSPEGKLLDVKIQPLVSTIAPGQVLRLQTDLLNLGQSKKIDVQFDLELMDVNTGEVLARTEEAFAVETTISTIKNLTIPESVKPGKYMVKGTAYYSNPEQTNMQASSIAYINVEYPILQRKILWVPVWIYLIIAAAIALLIGAYFYLRYLSYKNKRFKLKVDLTKLPQPGPNSGFIGKVAESDIRTFIDMNKLQMHTLIAGSTGSGKTVAAQGIIEEALIHKKSIIVFDPTAQWTGFLRKTDDKTMIRRYRYFDMKTGEIRAFNGTIKTIHDPYELINIKKYLDRPGEITIFNISRLTPKEMDIVVASTIEQIFKSNPDESKELKTLIVYDEVHRLLPKFGGSGQGFVQLERGAREFRKWGIGLFLISQVLSDFIGEIKANVGTEIQMGTRYEGDLERVNMKYGEDMLKSVVKEPIGTGMLTNAEFNNGRPYFVAFRPLLHSTKRLSNTELDKYEKYFDEVEDLEFQIAKLEEYGVDVLDLKLEIKLVKDKVKEGQFQMADMYLETLRPNIAEQWKKANKNPEHIVKEKISKEEVVKGIEKAKEEREEYLKKNPEAELSVDDEIKGLKNTIEEKKRKGKDTSVMEGKIGDFSNRFKSFKGKINPKDAEGIKQEIKSLKEELNKL